MPAANNNKLFGQRVRAASGPRAALPGGVKDIMGFRLNRRQFLGGTLAPAGCLAALQGCGSASSAAKVADSSQGTGTPPASTPAVNRGPTNDPPLLAIQSADLLNMAARPEYFFNMYQALAPGASAAAFMRQQLGSTFATLEDPGCLATYATVVSFNVAPTGDPTQGPFDATLNQLVNATALTCGHYCKLTTILTLLQYPQLIPPDATYGSQAKPTIHFVVWLDNVPLNTGIHSQLILSNVMDSAYLLLDPLYGFAMRIPYSSTYPQANLSVIDNAVRLLSTPHDPSNLIVLDPRGVASNPAVVPTMIGGQLNPSYIYYDALYGSIGWDDHIADTFRLIS